MERITLEALLKTVPHMRDRLAIVAAVWFAERHIDEFKKEYGTLGEEALFEFLGGMRGSAEGNKT